MVTASKFGWYKETLEQLITPDIGYSEKEINEIRELFDSIPLFERSDYPGYDSDTYKVQVFD